jgi:hypothetical protein
MKKVPVSEEVTVEVDGRSYSGSYSVTAKVVTVNCAYGSASTQIGGSTSKTIARLLLSEIVGGAKARGELA